MRPLFLLLLGPALAINDFPALQKLKQLEPEAYQTCRRVKVRREK